MNGAAANGGMIAMHKTIAWHYAIKGIMSYAICPGFTDTAMAGDYLASRGGPGLLAVDLGSGIGRDALPLLRSGWRVLAVDREQAALDELEARAAARGFEPPRERLGGRARRRRAAHGHAASHQELGEGVGGVGRRVGGRAGESRTARDGNQAPAYLAGPSTLSSRAFTVSMKASGVAAADAAGRRRSRRRAAKRTRGAGARPFAAERSPRAVRHGSIRQ